MYTCTSWTFHHGLISKHKMSIKIPEAVLYYGKIFGYMWCSLTGESRWQSCCQATHSWAERDSGPAGVQQLWPSHTLSCLQTHNRSLIHTPCTRTCIHHGKKKNYSSSGKLNLVNSCCILVLLSYKNRWHWSSCQITNLDPKQTSFMHYSVLYS